MEKPASASRAENPLISAVIPTLNEERNLPFLLGTLGWCHEVVIVDQGSEDRTVEIARESGARIVATEWQPAFDACRAIGIENASGEWILTLDADEMIPRSLAEQLQRWSRDPAVDIVTIPRLNYFMGPYTAGGFWPDPQPRFFRRDSLYIQAEVHSVYRAASDRQVSLPHRKDNAIHHFPYRGAGSLLSKLNTYTDLEVRKAPPDSGLLSQLVGHPAKIFLGRYLKHGAFKQGVRGLWLSLYWSLYAFMTALKRWEAAHLPEALDGELDQRHRLLGDWSGTRQ